MQRRYAGRGLLSALDCVAVAVWSLVFAAPHVYWAVGGRAGLGVQAAAAESALATTPFFIYNLVAVGLATGGAVLAIVLATRSTGSRLRRPLLFAAGMGSAVLLVRGGVGLVMLAVSALNGTFDEQTPAVLVAIEPWFLAGGVAFAWMVSRQRRALPGVETEDREGNGSQS